MTDERKTTEWRVIGETVPGASHLRTGIPNQDSILLVRQSSRALPIILSVSDGHGSPKCFRSERGSRFATQKAVFLLSEFLSERRGNFDLTEIESQKDHLSEEFVKRWREAVESDLKKTPFSEEEFEILEKKSDANARGLVESNPFLAYGATSLIVAAEEDFIIYMQLGDGEILNISPTGEVTKPLPEDTRLLANETTSLCLPKAEKDFRFFVQETSGDQSPALIMLSTDGYLNSFSSEAGFFQAGTDILEMLRAENGFSAVSDNLKSWLEEATQMGSGDDCTVAVIYCPDQLKKAAETETAEEIETKTVEKAETEVAQALAALTNETAASEDAEDVTVTITIKKDKNKKAVATVQTEPKPGALTKDEHKSHKESS